MGRLLFCPGATARHGSGRWGESLDDPSPNGNPIDLPRLKTICLHLFVKYLFYGL